MKRILAVVLALCGLCAPTWAETRNVSSVSELTTALSAAADGDVINLAAGTYSISSALSITKSVTLQGAGASSTILDGGKGNRIVIIRVSGVKLEGLTFQNGSHSTEGGALWLSSGAVVAEACDFKDNACGSGGGGAVYVGGSASASFKNCSFTGNKSGSWGGAIQGSGELKLEGCTFSSNTGGGQGGAVYASDNLEAKNCVFTGNDVGAGTQYKIDGGAIYVNYSSKNVTLDGCSFSNNTCSDEGGALYLYLDDSQAMTITDCDFIGNTAGGISGGAIYTTGDGGMTVRNCSFVDNKTTGEGSQNGVGSGGGIYWWASGEMTLINCVFTGNDAGNGYTGDNGRTDESRGGAVRRQDGSIKAIHCTFVNNQAQEGLELSSYNSLSGTQMNIVNSVIYNSGSDASTNYAIYTGQEGVTEQNTEAVKLDNCAATSDVLSHAGIAADDCKTISSWTPTRVTFKRSNGNTATVVQTSGITLGGSDTLTGKALSSVASEYTVDQTFINNDMTGRARNAAAPELGAVSSGTIDEPDNPQITPPVIQSFSVEGITNGGTLTVGQRYTATATATGESITWTVEADAALNPSVTNGAGSPFTFALAPSAASDSARVSVRARNDGGATEPRTLTFKIVAPDEPEQPEQPATPEEAAEGLEVNTPAEGSPEAADIRESLSEGTNSGGDQGDSGNDGNEGEPSEPGTPENEEENTESTIGTIVSEDIKALVTDLNSLDAGLRNAVYNETTSPLALLPQLQPSRTGIFVFKIVGISSRSGTLKFFPGEGGQVNGASVSLVEAGTTEGNAVYYSDDTYQNKIETLSSGDTSVVVATTFEKGKLYTPVVALENSGGSPKTPGGSSSSGCDSGFGALALGCAVLFGLRKK